MLEEVYDETVEVPVQYSLVCLYDLEEPGNFEAAEKEEKWQQAMREALSLIEGNDTWQLLDLPRGKKPIGPKWVYKLKRDSARTLVKYKVHLVAKGYVKNEVFASVARIETVWLLIALAAQRGWEIHNMDIKSAFLNGKLVKEVYVSQPPSFVQKGKEGNCSDSTRLSMASLACGKRRVRGMPN